MLASIVIAARNEEHYLKECLEAVFNQEFDKKWEVIVVDNNSSDATRDIAKSFACTIICEASEGQVRAKQTGCLAAKGEYIIVLDADCRPNKRWLSNIINKFLIAPEVSAITATYIYDDNPPLWGKLYNQYIHNNMVRMVIALRCLRFPFLIGGNVAFRSCHFREFKGYNISESFAETEIGLALNLRKYGEISFQDNIRVKSSSRRFRNGFLRFVLYDKIYNYLMVFLARRVYNIIMAYPRTK